IDDDVQGCVGVVVLRLTVTVVDPVLVACVVSHPYAADTVKVPAVVGVILTEQVADAPVPASVQVPPGVKVTVPVGVLVVPAAVSVTVAVHDVAWLMKTVDGVQATVVVVVRLLTVTLALPVLVPWLASPPYEAETVRVPETV